MGDVILSIDQGTSSSRAVVYDRDFRILGSAQQEFAQHYPKSGWVEHDPEDIWSGVVEVCQTAMQKAGADSVAAIGITNQRETTLIWDRETGEPIHRALVWQDRRTADLCARWREQGFEPEVTRKTGLKLDPYFSASKVVWLLEHVDGAREAAEKGRLAFGTIDSFLIYRLTGGQSHVTDITNASRTMLFNINDARWDEELLEMFGIPESLLPDVRDCVDEFGVTDCEALSQPTPIRGVAGDQQAALIGQAGLEEGVTKSTYGTGCFVIAHTGEKPRPSAHQLLTTVASRIDGRLQYGLEGSVFVAGSAIQWLRDELRVISHAKETEEIAEATGIVEDVYVVPAFAGLGAPYWDPDARGAILGLSRGSHRDAVVTATLQAIAFQTVDLMQAMRDDGVTPEVIRVDGGMVRNDWFLQFLSDVLAIPIERPVNIESTVLGAGYLAACGAGLIASINEVSSVWELDRRFEPNMPDSQRESLLAGWQRAVRQVRTT